MTLFLDYISSLEYWRTRSLPKGNPHPAAPSQRASHQPKQDTARQNCDLAVMRLYKEAACNTEHVDLEIELAILKEEVPNLTFPCHLLLPDASARRSSKDVICHVASPNRLPSRSFAAISNNVFVCSPELCFARAGITYNKMQLAQLGFELCGTYRLGHFTNGTEPNQLKTAASKLTSAKALDRFARLYSGKGCKAAKDVSRRILDSSASPMESLLALALSLPASQGGYGLPKPLLNKQISTVTAPLHSAFGNSFYCDLYWPDAKLDVEYDSELFHSGATKIGHDARRRNSLCAMGVSVITATKSSVTNRHGLDQLASQIARKLHVRLQLKRVNRDRQRELLDAFLHPGS